MAKGDSALFSSAAARPAEYRYIEIAFLGGDLLLHIGATRRYKLSSLGRQLRLCGYPVFDSVPHYCNWKHNAGTRDLRVLQQEIQPNASGDNKFRKTEITGITTKGSKISTRSLGTSGETKSTKKREKRQEEEEEEEGKIVDSGSKRGSPKAFKDGEPQQEVSLDTKVRHTDSSYYKLLGRTYSLK
jgi:hypothetical protein